VVQIFINFFVKKGVKIALSIYVASSYSVHFWSIVEFKRYLVNVQWKLEENLQVRCVMLLPCSADEVLKI